MNTKIERTDDDMAHPNGYWEARSAEAEAALEDCAKAFELIPVGALEAGKTWFPSEVALHLLKRAKDSLNSYATAHWHGAV